MSESVWGTAHNSATHFSRARNVIHCIRALHCASILVYPVLASFVRGPRPLKAPSRRNSLTREMNSRNQRRASRARQSPLDVAKEYVRKGTDQTGFVVKTVSDAVEKAFTKGEFLVEYRDKLGRSEATEHDDQTFIFHFQHGKNKMCIDATSDLCMAKMVNDDWREPNCKVKKETVDGKPHLLLFAIRDILPGQELRYDYGKEDAPWRMQDADVELEDDEDDTEDSGVEEGADEELEEDVDIEETDMKHGILSVLF
ncbi:putative N-lysine methyltransferase SETD8-A-like [Apostichopus japonicus]|uniref:Putative N-lysine methyltransferase SETD8-A-like n=1 Tax=Stichopus japonicus TaxID=307972 RepID=A0A2G8JMS5_STIJA|nr:putative N-lysine methyltransferase SETD8-A-like [Apostichopus japonicus]